MWSETSGRGPCFFPCAMKLYAYRYCPFSRRVRIALAEHSVEFEYVEQAPEAAYPAELRGKVPGEHGVPVLVVRDDFVLWDSGAIIHWVDSAHPRSLFPSQRDPQALARAWQGWAEKLYPKLKELREGGEDEIIKALRDIDKMIETQWLVGEEFTVADIALAPVLAELSSKSIATLPKHVREYVGRVRARPSVREVCELDLPDEQRPSVAA